MDRPWGLDYWDSKDWEIVREKLDGNQSSGIIINPSRDMLLDNLRSLSPSEVRVVLTGQDPYPDGRFATGHAFSIPRTFERSEFPSSLKVLFRELSEDLAIKYPTHGDLQGWVNQGVLLWNVIPTCTGGMSRSHDWREYHSLTTEIFRRILSDGSGCVFAFLGAVARRYEDIPGKDNPNFPTIVVGHPSPRGNASAKQPFAGSRLFSTINAKLTSIGLEPIDWRLDARNQLIGDPEVARHVHLREGVRILPNTSGEPLGVVYDK